MKKYSALQIAQDTGIGGIGNENVVAAAAWSWQTAHRTMLAKVMVGLAEPLFTNIWQTQGHVKEVESL